VRLPINRSTFHMLSARGAKRAQRSGPAITITPVRLCRLARLQCIHSLRHSNNGEKYCRLTAFANLTVLGPCRELSVQAMRVNHDDHMHASRIALSQRIAWPHDARAPPTSTKFCLVDYSSKSSLANHLLRGIPLLTSVKLVVHKLQGVLPWWGNLPTY
jgi:hypothetical protein